jgi:hypothetical protein
MGRRFDWSEVAHQLVTIVGGLGIVVVLVLVKLGVL